MTGGYYNKLQVYLKALKLVIGFCEYLNKLGAQCWWSGEHECSAIRDR